MSEHSESNVGAAAGSGPGGAVAARGGSVRATGGSSGSTGSSEVDPLVTPGRVIGVVLVLISLTALFHDFFFRQIKWAVLQQADWGHTLVMPLIAGYFVYFRRDRLREIGLRTNWLGFIPIILGVGLYSLTTFGPKVLVHHNLHGASVGLTLFGVVVLFAGIRATALVLWFPVVYVVVFGQSISNHLMEIVTREMQDIAARGSEMFLTITGSEVERTGNTIYMYHGENEEPMPLNIAEACSGMRMLMAFLALGVAMAYTGLRRWWQRILLVLLAFPTAIFVNILRVATLAWLSKINPEFTVGDFHTFIGLVWLVPAYLIYLGLRYAIRMMIVEVKEPKKKKDRAILTRPLFDSSARTALIAVCVCFAVVGVGFRVAVGALNVHLNKEALPLRQSFRSIPSTIGPWRQIGTDQILGEATVESLGTNDYLSRTYIHEDYPREPIRFHLAYYTGGLDPIPHVPDRCFEAAGLIQITDPAEYDMPYDRTGWVDDPLAESYRSPGTYYPVVRLAPRGQGGMRMVHMPLQEFGIRLTEFHEPDDPDRTVYGGYFFIANGRVTPSPYAVKSLAFDPKESYAYYCKLQFSMSTKMERDEFIEFVSTLSKEVLPEVMWCLPDWPEIEERMYGDAEESASSPSD